MTNSEKLFNKDGHLAKRLVLAEHIPLSQLLSVQFGVSEFCNFSCFYCKQPALRKRNYKFQSLKLDTFKTYADSIRENGKIKRLQFCGMGEPLTNPCIADMLAYSKQIGLSDTFDIVSNGYLLTDELADKLLDAGMNAIKISLQGINAEQYNKNCGVRIDFDKFLRQLRYFYDQSRGRCEIYMKAIDVMFQSEAERGTFYEIFSPLCDSINIEGLQPTNGISPQDDRYEFKMTEFGYELGNDDSVCPMPFYFAYVNIDGAVYTCCVLGDSVNIWNNPCIGNMNEQKFSDIWNGRKHLDLMKSLLHHHPVSVCESCVAYRYRIATSDIINGYERQIIERLEELERKVLFV
jgi:MoaA/NifB/PqqE/SkfB family radical SAM enzyme